VKAFNIMNLKTSVDVMLRTHMAALAIDVRAVSIEQISGPGIGKSDSKLDYARKLAQAVDQPVGYVRCVIGSLGSSADLRGFGIPGKDADGTLITKFARPGWYPHKSNMTVFLPDGSEVEEGEWTEAIPAVGVFDMDEFGQAEDDMKKVAADILLYGRCGDVKLPKGWRVVASSNRMSDRSGVARALTFLTNRRMEMVIEPHLPDWIDWCNSQDDLHRPHYLTMSFAQKNPDLVFRDAVPPGHDPFCTPRTLVMADFVLRSLRSPEDIAKNKLPLDPAAREACAGLMGKTETAQFYTHLKYADELPDIADIIKSPGSALLPPTRDAQMVCGYFLAHNVDDTTAVPILKYMSRMQKEMQILTMRALIAQADKNPARVSSALDTKEAGAWFMLHKDVIIASRS
jgi:hypothetical protein